MAAERDLDALLKNMKPELQAGIFVFCTIPPSDPILAALNPLLAFREQEGTTLVILRERSRSGGIALRISLRA